MKLHLTFVLKLYFTIFNFKQQLTNAQYEVEATTEEVGACYDDYGDELLSEPEDEIDIDFGPEDNFIPMVTVGALTSAAIFKSTDGVTYLGEQTIVENEEEEYWEGENSSDESESTDKRVSEKRVTEKSVADKSVSEGTRSTTVIQHNRESQNNNDEDLQNGSGLSDGIVKVTPSVEVDPTMELVTYKNVKITENAPTKMNIIPNVVIIPSRKSQTEKKIIPVDTQKPRKRIPCKNMKIPPTTPEPPLLKKYTNLQGAEQSLTNALLVLAGMGFLALIGLLLFLCWKCITRKRKSKHPQHYDDFYDSNTSNSAKVLIDGKQSDRKFLGGVSGSRSIVNAQNDDNTLAHDVPLLPEPITRHSPKQPLHQKSSDSSDRTEFSLESGNYPIVLKNTSNCSLTQQYICENSVSRSLNRHSSYGNISRDSDEKFKTNEVAVGKISGSSCICHRVANCKLNEPSYIDEALETGRLQACTCGRVTHKSHKSKNLTEHDSFDASGNVFNKIEIVTNKWSMKDTGKVTMSVNKSSRVSKNNIVPKTKIGARSSLRKAKSVSVNSDTHNDYIY